MDSFELRLTHHLRGVYAPNLARIKAKIAELQKLVNEQHERILFSMPVIMEIHSKKVLKNTWSVEIKEKGRKKKRTRKGRNSVKKRKTLRN